MQSLAGVHSPWQHARPRLARLGALAAVQASVATSSHRHRLYLNPQAASIECGDREWQLELVLAYLWSLESLLDLRASRTVGPAEAVGQAVAALLRLVCSMPQAAQTHRWIHS